MYHSTAANKNRYWYTMGKKGKRSAKTGDGKAKQGPGKARRERAAGMKEINAGVTALIERLESETTDVELYGPLTEQEDCPICFLPLPLHDAEHVYMACCGQLICGGCAHASSLICKKMKKSELCAFCRSETGQDDKAMVAQLRSRLEKNDVSATNNLAARYREGDLGLPKDEVMGLRLLLRAAELGSLVAIGNLASYFFTEDDVPQDSVFAMQLAMTAAKKGDWGAYSMLGCIYAKQEDVENAAKNFIFAARAGHEVSMEFLRSYKVDGAKLVSDDDLEAIDEAYKEAVKLEWSEEREAFKKFHHDSFN